MFSLVWLLLLARITSSVTTSILSENDTLLQGNKISIFLLAGQSNMAGRGGVTNGTWNGIIPSQCRPNPQVLRLSAANAWEEGREPLHRDIDTNKSCGIGPGMVFAHYVLKKDKGIGTIGLVPCAIGGTKITEWRRGGWLYNQLIARAEVAVGNGGGIIKAILWYQGESDAENFADAELYKARLEEFFNNVRSDLAYPALPVIQVALASGEGPFVYTIRKAQQEIDVPNVRTVDAMGLQLEPDALHLTSEAQVRLGQKLADAFLEITAPLPARSSATKPLPAINFDSFCRWLRLR